jgi:hypothetical protein
MSNPPLLPLAQNWSRTTPKSARITSYLTSFGDEMAGPSDLSRLEDDLAEMITGDQCSESCRGIS